MVGAAERRLMQIRAALLKVPSKVSRKFASFVTKDLKRQAYAGNDPYGKPHAALRPATVRKKGSDAILDESGALIGSLAARPMGGSGLQLTVDPPYARYHITGTKRMVARAFFPIGRMPAAWSAELKRLTNEALNASV